MCSLLQLLKQVESLTEIIIKKNIPGWNILWNKNYVDNKSFELKIEIKIWNKKNCVNIFVNDKYILFTFLTVWELITMLSNSAELNVMQTVYIYIYICIIIIGASVVVIVWYRKLGYFDGFLSKCGCLIFGAFQKMIVLF
jgi:hypothetical protein